MKRNFLLNALFFLTSWGAIAQPPTINLSTSVGTPATSVTVSWDAHPASYSISGVVDPFMVNGVYINYRELTSPASAWLRTALLPRTQTSWVHSGVVAGKTYEYSFQTNVTVGTLTYDSPEPPASTAIAGSFNRYVTAVIPATVTPPPAANLSHILGSAPNSIDLSWVAQVGTNVGNVRILYRVYESGNDWSMSPTFMPSATSWTHTGLMPGTVYEYSLQVGTSASPIVWTPNPPASSAGPNYQIARTSPATPDTPRNLFVDQAKTTPTSHTLSWQDFSTTESGYEIAFSGDGVNFTTVRTVGVDINSYVLGGLTPNRNVVMKVRAYNTSAIGVEQFSPYSNIVAVRTLKAQPVAPIALTEVVTCVNDATFFWSHPSVGDVEGFWVEQSPNNVDWRVIDKFPVGAYNLTAPYRVQNLPSGQDQYFRIRAVTNVNSINPAFKDMGPTSSVLKVTTKVAAAPMPPFNLREIIKTDSVITFGWDLSNDMDFVCNTNVRTGIIVRFSINDGPFQVRFLGANETLINLRDLPQGAKVVFGVNGVNNVYQLESAIVYITSTLLGPPAAPSNLITRAGIDVFRTPNVFMSWTDNSNNEDKFFLEATIDTVAGVGLSVPLATNVNFFTHVPVDEGVSWFYRAYAQNTYGRSVPTNWVLGKVEFSKIPENPYDLKGRLTNGKIFLNWKDDTLREENFEVERSEDDETTFERVGMTNRNSLMFTDSTMQGGKTYKYRVRAVNTLGASGYTNMVTFTMPAVVATTSSTLVEDLISVFPNPAVSQVRVSLPEFISEEGGFVSIFDQSQKLIYRSKISVNNNEYSFDMQNLRDGMYMVVITTDTQKISKKIYKR